jgi:uncharacterized membrane protein
MAFCNKCGSEVPAGAAFCPKCGAAQAGGAAMAPPGQSAQSELSENVAGLLCYLFWWVTGIVFFMIDKRPYVRFHAAQSIVVFGGLGVLYILNGILFRAGFMFMGGFGAFGLGAVLHDFLDLVGLILWILLMVKAYQGEKFEVPIAADIAKGFAGN